MNFKKRYKLKTLFIGFLFFLSCTNAWSLPVIFDLNGVLVETNKMAAFGTFWKELILFTSTLHNPLKAKTRLFEILNLIKPLPADALPAEDGEGTAIPQLIRDWLSGSMNTKELKAVIANFCNEHPEVFKNYAEKQLILAIANMMFTPERFVKTQTLNSEGLAFARYCKEQGHDLYILSNWDAESFDLMLERYPELFELFDGILISGNAGCIKPDTRIYEILLESYNINPYDAIFIDDQQNNLYAAQKLGIHTILCAKSRSLYTPWSCNADFTTVRSAFDSIIAHKMTA
jgi:FMN phosphatase YigB (HAD superfamily)